jgi:hypothetical protein
MLPLTDILFSAFFAFTALTSATCFMFHTLKMKAVVRPELFITRSQLRVSKILSSALPVSLFSTSISITYSLLPKAYYFLPRRSCIDTITPFWRLPLPLLSREDATLVLVTGRSVIQSRAKFGRRN